MKYVTHTTFITAVISLVLMRLHKTMAAAAVVQEDDRFELRGPKYPLELFPIIDELNIEKAFTKRTYMVFLLKCVFFEGPCDLVGKWLKPRTLAALYGKCLVCTDFQQENMEGWLLTLIRHNEDLFRLAMVKVCVDMKIKVPEDEKQRMRPLLAKKDIKRIYSTNQT